MMTGPLDLMITPRTPGTEGGDMKRIIGRLWCAIRGHHVYTAIPGRPQWVCLTCYNTKPRTLTIFDEYHQSWKDHHKDAIPYLKGPKT
jgi:hypothetical protein